MGLLHTAAGIAEQSLRQIGVFSPIDTSPDPSSFRIALQWLDMLVSELVGTKELWFFVPTNQEIELTADVRAYNLFSLLGDNVQFVQHVFLIRDNKKTELIQARKDDYDGWDTDEQAGTGGCPEFVYIERKDTPMLYLDSPPIAGDTLLVAGQKYSSNLTHANGNLPHGFPAAWQLTLITALSAKIGAGPVVRLPENEITGFKEDAIKGLFDLEQKNNQEQVRKPRFVANEDF